MSLAAAFLGRDVCYIVRASLVYSNKAGIWSICVLSLVELYFFYTRFMWMALAGFEMCRNIYSGIKLKFVSQREKKKLFIVYLLLGWGVPLLLDAIVAAMMFSDRKMFFEIGINFIILVPVGLTLLFNIGVVIFLSFLLHNAAARRKRIIDNVKRCNTIFVRVFLVILSVLGLPWVLVFLLLIRRVHVNLLAIFHILMNISQPLVVSIAFIGTKKVIQKYLGLCGSKQEDKNTKETSGKQKKSRRLMSLLFASRDIENSAQQQEEENIESNGGGSVMSPGSANGLIMPHNDESGSHGVSDVS